MPGEYGRIWTKKKKKKKRTKKDKKRTKKDKKKDRKFVSNFKPGKPRWNHSDVSGSHRNGVDLEATGRVNIMVHHDEKTMEPR